MAVIWLLSFGKITNRQKKLISNEFCFLFCKVNFAPGIWLLGLWKSVNVSETNVSRNDCSGDYNQSFVYMIIAQFNYFIWPFIVLCVLNMLLMLNIWKRGRKMNRFRTNSQQLKTKERTEDRQTLERPSYQIQNPRNNQIPNCSSSCSKQQKTSHRFELIFKEKEKNSLCK